MGLWSGPVRDHPKFEPVKPGGLMRSLFSVKSALLLAVLCSGIAMMAQRPSAPYGATGPNGYGQYGGGYAADEGYRRGFDDGMRSGQADVQRGKRGDPTKSENYEDAPGYNSSYGDKGQWKQQYRQGYMAGYQRAIYGDRRL